MSQPILYEHYDRHQAIAFVGEESQAESLCDGQWLIFSHAVICLTVIGGPPKLSHFVSGSTFLWVADKPYHVNEERYTGFVPAQVVGPKAKSRRIWLFVRLESSEKYLYLGDLEPSYMQQAPGPQNHGMAQFELRPTLPSLVWAQLGGLKDGETDAESVDRALDRLKSPTTVNDRLEILRRLVEYWHGPIQPSDGLPEAELNSVELPDPLKWWYRWAGRRSAIMSGQNSLLSPQDQVLRREDDRLLFYLENQAVYRWGTLDHGDDPPVFGRYNKTDPWEPEGITLTEHLILACMFEGIICHSQYGASAACLDEKTLKKIEEVVTSIAIGPWRWLGPTRFYARNGVLMVAMSNGTDVYSVWIGAKTEKPLHFLKPYLDEAWEYIAV